MKDKHNTNDDDDIDDENNFPKDLCSECNERYSIKKCHQCDDDFCTPCYKVLHKTGTRANHTFDNLGPIDCSECEMLLGINVI